ncbi:MAG: hypothetical protein LBG11_06825, partial [Bifidobacteriaceae bacterium]|nr:hypothetical protein [Bifidobacteriaceae bacterium]
MSLNGAAALRARRTDLTGAHSPVVRVSFYCLGAAMIVVDVVALLGIEKLGATLGSDFAGLLEGGAAWRTVVSDPLARCWALGSLLLLVAAMGALWFVRSARIRELEAVEVTQLNASGWRRVYMQRLVITDLVVVLWSMVGAQVFWLGPHSLGLGVLGSASLPYGWVGIGIGVGWAVTLQVVGARDPLTYGEGTTEYGRVIAGSFGWFGVVAILALVFKADFARGYVLIAFPLGTLGLLFSRWVWRKWLLTKRRQGLYSARSVVIGDADAVGLVVKELSRKSPS